MKLPNTHAPSSDERDGLFKAAISLHLKDSKATSKPSMISACCGGIDGGLELSIDVSVGCSDTSWKVVL